MIDVLSHRMLGTLNGNEVFVGIGAIGTRSRTQAEVVNPFVPFVFVSLDEIPPQHEMFCDVNHALSYQSHGNIVPGHSPIIRLVQFIIGPIFDGLEVHDSAIAT